MSESETKTYTYTIPVRIGDENSRPIVCGSEIKELYKGDSVVVLTSQGLQLGAAEGDAMEMRKLQVKNIEVAVVRKATQDDLNADEENKKENDIAFELCKKEIEALDLKMNLLSATYTLDRSKVLFVYLADQRVDFRDLLKILGAKLHCRIELRQIGERDKAKMVGGIGMCGMECCCRRFKTKFDVISINMAKNQMLALNVDKLSGMCGKLMCCLKYEDDAYSELNQGLPKMGSQVEYEGQIYRVTSMNVMRDEAKLENYESVIFLNLNDLRTKAIPRKGVVMSRPTNDKDTKLTVKDNRKPHREHTCPCHKAEHQAKAETRKFTPRQEKTPKQEVKNVTVRTFKKKGA